MTGVSHIDIGIHEVSVCVRIMLVSEQKLLSYTVKTATAVFTVQSVPVCTRKLTVKFTVLSVRSTVYLGNILAT